MSQTVRKLAWTAAALSVGYAIAGCYWMRGGDGFPFGLDNDPLAHKQSILESLTQSAGAPWVVAAGIVGAVTALVMRRPTASRAMAVTLTVLASVQGVLYALIIPDGRPLIAAAHVPILVVGKPFGWPEGVTIASQVPWPVVNQMILKALGLLWAALAVAYWRRHRGACQRCGRAATPRRWTQPESAARWGRFVVAVAVVPPLFYATTRVGWAAGLPVGVTDSFIDDANRETPGMLLAGLFIASLAIAGAVLTLGLTLSWGETWPRWIPVLRGRRVRPGFAIVPATVASVLITGDLGVGWIRATANGWFPESPFGPNWGTTLPGAFMPLWGIALAAAAYAYHLRRRARCRRCGRGGPQQYRQRLETTAHAGDLSAADTR
jgi:hypothetical protein